MMNHPQATTSPHDNTPSSMLAVMVLALSAFVFNTTEFIPIALLTDIGASFGMNASQTGVMMTVYAWVVAVMSLPMMLITAKMERKKLLLSLFLVFVLAHGLSFWANSFGHLLVCRVLIALTHAIFLVNHLKPCAAFGSQRQTNLCLRAACHRLGFGDRAGFTAWATVGADAWLADKFWGDWIDWACDYGVFVCAVAQSTCQKCRLAVKLTQSHQKHIAIDHLCHGGADGVGTFYGV